MIKKVIKFLYDIIGMPYYAVIKVIKAIIVCVKYAINYVVKFIKNIPSILKYIGKWLIDAVKESIAQIFTLLGFFIAWFTLTGSAQDIVGIAIIVSTIIWLLTIYIRED